MSDFAAAFLIILALASVGTFASDGDVFGTNCIGNRTALIQICR